MAGGFRLPRLPAQYTKEQFQLWWQSTVEAIEFNENAQNDLISQLQASLQLSGGAVAGNDAATGTAKSGQATATGLTVDSGTWVNGPQVALSGISGSMTKLLLTGTGPQSASVNGGPMDGEYRVQEVVGLSETTVFTGTFTLRSLPNGSPNITLGNPPNNQVFVRSANPNATYRLDLRKTAGAGFATNLTAYIFARRYP